jgi:uncharacterized membrane protein (DUF485 family)
MTSAADAYATVVGLAVSAVGVFVMVALVTVRFYEFLLATVYAAEARLDRLKKQVKEEKVGLKREELLA